MSAEFEETSPATLETVRERYLPRTYVNTQIRNELLTIVPLTSEEMEEMLGENTQGGYSPAAHRTLEDAYVTANYIRSFLAVDLPEGYMEEAVRRPQKRYDNLTMAELFKTRQFERVIEGTSRLFSWSGLG